MSSPNKQFLKNYKKRTKSNEKLRNITSNSPSSRPSSNHITKNSTPQISLLNGLKHYNNMVKKNNLNQKGQLQIEGELTFLSKNTKLNTSNQGKNLNHNSFEFISHLFVNFKNKKKKKVNNKIPRKSPVASNKSMAYLHYFPLHKLKFLNISHSNSIHPYTKRVKNKNKNLTNNNNSINKTYNTFRPKNIMNRSLSPISKSNNSGNKIPPNSIKQKYLTKSPNSGEIDRLKYYTNSNLSSHRKKNFINKSMIKKNIYSNFIYNKKINNVCIHKNKQLIISGDLSNDLSNIKINNSAKSGNVSLSNNISNYNDSSKKNNQIKQNLTSSKLSENLHTTETKYKPLDNLNRNIIKNLLHSNFLDNKCALKISLQLHKPQKTERKEIEKKKKKKGESSKEISKREKIPKSKKDNSKSKKFQKHSQRSLSQPDSDFIKSKIEKYEKNEKKNEKIKKKIKKIQTFTHVGFDGEQDKENNQDSFFIYPNFSGQKDYYYFSVCDGHGVEGHFISNFLKETLPKDLSHNLYKKNILYDTELIHEIIIETFLLTNEKLIENEKINSTFSGSTCVSVIYTPQKLICPNVGDSRAVIGRYNKENKIYESIELTRDHKPIEEDEARRIIENDGRIQPFTDEGEFIGPQRVWVKDDDVPGLAMTRSFGDRVAATVGVISEPEIKEWEFKDEDKFMIIASDGVWEFISSQECVNFIGRFYNDGDMEGCCQFLYQESKKRWLAEEEVVDDITMILVFFE